jgi:hypothetical protein
VIVPGDGAFVITDRGTDRLAGLGLDVEAILGGRRATARACVDWSERRPHVGGALGAALLAELLDRRWLQRVTARGTQGRALRITSEGRAGVLSALGVTLPER